jgi:hypothetical protein
MDLSKIKSAVLNQLTNTNGLYSLRIQNHIYGCFIIMEDIAQSVVDLSGTTILNEKYSFDFDKQFSDIGLRYGFAMDSKLALDKFNPEYKETWLQYFKDIDLAKDIQESDKIEDAIIEIVQNNTTSEEAFFIQALESGSLPQEWIEKVFNLINPPRVSLPIEKETEVEVEKTALTKATSEKPLNMRSRLATTRRANSKISTTSKKSLAKTRRHH